MNPLNEWYEEYEKCGCVSPVERRKVDLPGYCPKHGNSRRVLYKNYVPVERRTALRRFGASSKAER
jgi:hypothetical protein